MANVIEVVDVDDDDFLSMVAEVEAQALTSSKSKRPKVSEPEIPEGPYMAALRGSRSALWQQQQQKGATTTTTRGGFSGTASSNAEGEVPEKPCPCGSGSCLVRTSNTAKNPGRKFYRCPLREENGGCSFFEWCDNPSAGVSAPRSHSHYQSNSSVPDLPCPCGAGSCLVLIAKTGNHVGRHYYRCPANEGGGYCGFFKWCSDPLSEPVANQSTVTSQYNPSSQFSGERSGSSCFKCGLEGHWARDCPTLSSDFRADAGLSRVASSGSGYVSGPGYGSGPGSGSGSCFKCGKAGHWARDCPMQEASAGSGGSTPFSYKRKYVE